LETDDSWKKPYNAALRETDRGKLLRLLPAAKTAIDARLRELQMDHGGTPAERRAISDALASLNVVRQELESGFGPLSRG
jgi:hypothetical protein